MHARVDAHDLETMRRSINVIFYWIELIIKKLAFYDYSLWLFIVNNMKTIIVSSLVFEITNALVIEKYEMRRHDHNSTKNVIWRISFIILWIWMNFLSFIINN